MKNIFCYSFLSSILFLLIAITSIYSYPTSRDVTEVQLPDGEQRGHDLVLRDDKEPLVAAFNYENNTLSIMSCGEYGFGGPGLRTDTNGCNRMLTFDFRWSQDFSYHPRKKSDVTITIREGDTLHGEFTFDSCAKVAKGIIRDENQNIVLMELRDTDTSGKRGFCSGPPDWK